MWCNSDLLVMLFSCATSSTYTLPLWLTRSAEFQTSVASRLASLSLYEFEFWFVNLKVCKVRRNSVRIFSLPTTFLKIHSNFPLSSVWGRGKGEMSQLPLCQVVFQGACSLFRKEFLSYSVWILQCVVYSMCCVVVCGVAAPSSVLYV